MDFIVENFNGCMYNFRIFTILCFCYKIQQLQSVILAWRYFMAQLFFVGCAT